MRAIRIHENGGPEVLTLDDIDVPEPGPGEARVRIEAAGVNFIDTYHRAGRYPLPLPTTLGVEAGGVIDALGEGVEGFSPGDRVAYSDQLGSYAEYQVVPAASLVPVPDDLDMTTAVAALLQGMTAHFLCHDTYPVADETTALVHAAAGGVGQLLTQMCKLRGGRVIATCGTQEKAELARALGADEVIVYTEESFADAVRKLTDGRGVDVVYDGVGKTTFRDGLTCIRPRGLMVLYGQASGPVEPLDPQELNKAGSLFLTRPTLCHHVSERAELERRASDLFGWVASGELKVRVDRTFPLEEAADAHRYIEARNTHGKLLLTP
jgi:NADPH:quinone reductase